MIGNWVFMIGNWSNKYVTALHCLYFLYPWFLISLKLRSSSFRLHQAFSTLMVQMLFFPNSTNPWPQLQKGRKIPVKCWTFYYFSSQIKMWSSGPESTNSCHNSKQGRPWSDCFFKSSLIWVCTVCLGLFWKASCGLTFRTSNVVCWRVTVCVCLTGPLCVSVGKSTDLWL